MVQPWPDQASGSRDCSFCQSDIGKPDFIVL